MNEPIGMQADRDAEEAWQAWLATLGRDPVMASREDPEDAFKAGFAAGYRLFEHSETHYGQVQDCRYCQQQRAAGR
jgi:hypothetical protein